MSVCSLIELLNYIWNKVHTVRQQIAACTVCSLKGTNNEIKLQSVIDKDAQGVSAREIYRQNVEKYMNDASQHFLGAWIIGNSSYFSSLSTNWRFIWNVIYFKVYLPWLYFIVWYILIFRWQGASKQECWPNAGPYLTQKCLCIVINTPYKNIISVNAWRMIRECMANVSRRLKFRRMWGKCSLKKIPLATIYQTFAEKAFCWINRQAFAERFCHLALLAKHSLKTFNPLSAEIFAYKP